MKTPLARFSSLLFALGSFEKNIPAFENVAALDQLPATGAYIIALPLKIKGGSGGPLRIVAWVTEKR